MVALDSFVQKLDAYFGVRELDSDPAFAHWLPQAYSETDFPWRDIFEETFCSRFNGLMLRGSQKVVSVFCAAFPSPFILDQFIAQSQPGDLLFTHHPINMECGDPQGEWGRGFHAIDRRHLDAVIAQRLSIYSCHAPLDTHSELSTNSAIAAALKATVLDRFLPYGNGFAGLLCTIPKTNTETLIESCREVFDIPYVDFGGQKRHEIECIAITAGGGDRVACMREVEERGAQAYLTGEIHHRIDTPEWRERFREMEKFLSKTRMSAIGVSHAASEFLVMKTDMAAWFSQHFDVEVRLLPETRWWR